MNVRVCQFLQVIVCTAMLPIMLRHISWPSNEYEADNDMSTQNQPSGILPLELHHKILSSKKAASLNQMVTRIQRSLEKGKPNIFHFSITTNQLLLTHIHLSYFRFCQQGYSQKCECDNFYLSYHEKENHNSHCIQD